MQTLPRRDSNYLQTLLKGTIRASIALLTLGNLSIASAQSTSLFGTLSNFDVYNTTPVPCEGFEIELEGIHSSDLIRTFPTHFMSEVISEYSDAFGSGVRIRYENYYFRESNGTEHFSINPTVNPQSTNGHQAVNVVDIEHFGFSLRGAQPTATRTYWLDQLGSGQFARATVDPLPIPMPNWSYIPPANPGAAPIVRAQLEVPEREVVVQQPDSIWMKVYKTEMEREVDLDELVSGPGIVPQDESETEIEWELLEGGKMNEKDVEVNENGRAVIRRYEFFTYTGPYDVEHEPTTPFLDDDTLDPVALGHVGNFIAANMVAANLAVVPELTSSQLLAVAVSSGLVWASIRRRVARESARPAK